MTQWLLVFALWVLTMCTISLFSHPISICRKWKQKWAVSVCLQVSDSLRPPEQEAALLLKAEGLLLLQCCLLPAPHAFMVPRQPQPHKHTQALWAHPLVRKSRSVWPTCTCIISTTCVDVFRAVSDLSVSDSVGYCRGSDFLMDVNYLQYLWDAQQAISASFRSVYILSSWMIK